MLTPWEAFPHLEWGSLGWRMGDGENYWALFWDCHTALSEPEQLRYKAGHPEPDGWQGFYKFLESDGEDLPDHWDESPCGDT